MNRRQFLVGSLAGASVSGLTGPKSIQASGFLSHSIMKAADAVAIQPKLVTERVTNPTIDSKRGQVELVKQTTKPQNNATECVIVQASKENSGPQFTDPFSVIPLLKGSDKDPDIALSLQLEGFHLSGQEKINDKSRATMRITTSNTTSLTATGETLFWAITTGINLYKQSKRAERDKTKSVDNLTGALSNRPIEMKDGMGSFQIQILQHDDAPWWRNLFSFLASDDADIITESFGYPAITKPALRFLDSLLEKLGDLNAKPLIESNFVPYALSERGRGLYETGINVIGRLNSGSWILVKPKDFPLLVDKKPYFYGTAGRLIPTGKTPLSFLQEVDQDPKNDPFYEITYAVFSSTLKERNFSP